MGAGRARFAVAGAATQQNKDVATCSTLWTVEIRRRFSAVVRCWFLRVSNLERLESRVG